MVTEVWERMESVVAPRTMFGAIVGWIGAIAFAVSGLWFGAIAMHLSVAEPPAGEAGPVAYFTWFVTTLQQERIDTSIAIAGFACLIVLARLVATRDRRDRVQAGAAVMSLGAAIWIVGNILQLAAHRAVGLLATHNNPLGTTNSIAFTADMIDDGFEMAGFAVLAVGAFLLAGRAASLGWRRMTIALGAVCALLAVAYITGPDALVDGALVFGGLAVVPIWLVWTGGTLDGPLDTVRV